MIEPMVPDHIERVKVCPWCDYDLRGREVEECPECGADVRPWVVMKHREGGQRIVLVCYWLNGLLPILYVAVAVLLIWIEDALSMRSEVVLPSLVLQPVVGGSAVGWIIASGYRRRMWNGEHDKRGRVSRIVVTVLLHIVLTFFVAFVGLFLLFAFTGID